MKTQLLTISLTALLAAGPALGQESVGTASYEAHDGSPVGATEQPAEKPKADRKRLWKAGGLGCLAGGAAAFLSGKRDKALTGCVLGAAVGSVASYRKQMEEAEELAEQARAAGMTAQVQTKEVQADDGQKVQALSQVVIVYDPATVAQRDAKTVEVFDRISALAKKSNAPLTIAVEGSDISACQVPLTELYARGTFPPATAVDNCGQGQARILISPMPDLT